MTTWMPSQTVVPVAEDDSSEAVSHRDAGQEPASAASPDPWAKSVGETAAPILAGFSVTVVIVVSDDAKDFRWPGWAILALTVSAIALIGALQSAKYAQGLWPGANRPQGSQWWTHVPYFTKDPAERAAWWGKWTRRFYHFGLAALLAGLAFTLAPPDGARQGGLRWAASVLAFLAFAVESLVFLTSGRDYEPAGGQDKKHVQLPGKMANGFANETGRHGGDDARHRRRSARSLPGQRDAPEHPRRGRHV